MKMQTLLLMMLSLISINAYAIKFGIDEKAKGDVIAVRTDDQMASWCNFDKQVVRGVNYFLCIYNGKTTEA